MSNFRDLVELHRENDDTFTTSIPGQGFMFGGLILSLLTRAGANTVAPGLLTHAVHTSFLNAGACEVPVQLTVERMRDGRSFATRRVTLTQETTTVAVATLSFHSPEPGIDWQQLGPLGGPEPESLSPIDTFVGGIEAHVHEARPLDARHATGEIPKGKFPLHPYWARIPTPLGEDPGLHASGLMFVSDFFVVFNASPPGRANVAAARTITIDHSVWIHRPFRSDEWFLAAAEPLTFSAGRGLIRGTFTDRHGRLFGSFAQETLTRATTDPRWTRALVDPSHVSRVGGCCR